MKNARVLLFVTGFALAAVAALAQSVDDAALQSIQVTSGRSSAMAQFNWPAVRLWLPRVANSAYVESEFKAPQVVDAKGAPVAHEVESGIYEHDLWKDEIRIQTKGQPARILGAIHLRYPVRIRPAAATDAPDKVTQPAFDVKLPAAVVEQWKEVDITYDLPVVEKFPASMNGASQPLQKMIAPTPGAKVVVTVKK